MYISSEDRTDIRKMVGKRDLDSLTNSDLIKIGREVFLPLSDVKTVIGEMRNDDRVS